MQLSDQTVVSTRSYNSCVRIGLSFFLSTSKTGFPRLAHFYRHMIEQLCIIFMKSGVLITTKGSADAIQGSSLAQTQGIQMYVIGVTTDGAEVAEISQMASPSNCIQSSADPNFFLTSNVNELASRLTEPLARKLCGLSPQVTGGTLDVYYPKSVSSRDFCF